MGSSKEILDMRSPLAIVLLGLILILSCEDTTDCGFDSNTNVLNVQFSRLDTAGDISELQVSYHSIFALGADSAQFTGDTLSLFPLQVNPIADSTLFIFQNDSLQDTLLVSYDASQMIISFDCGPTQTLFNLEVNDSISTFDSLSIIDKRFDRTVPINIEIIFVDNP